MLGWLFNLFKRKEFPYSKHGYFLELALNQKFKKLDFDDEKTYIKREAFAYETVSSDLPKWFIVNRDFVVEKVE